jgi:hypothetical protein
MFGAKSVSFKINTSPDSHLMITGLILYRANNQICNSETLQNKNSIQKLPMKKLTRITQMYELQIKPSNKKINPNCPLELFNFKIFLH